MENNNSLKRRFFATYYDTPARVVYGGEDLHIECDGWYPGLLEGDLEGYYLLLNPPLFEPSNRLKNLLIFATWVDEERQAGRPTHFMNLTVQNLIDLGWIKLR